MIDEINPIVTTVTNIMNTRSDSILVVNNEIKKDDANVNKPIEKLR